MKLFPSIDAAASWLRMPNGQKRSQSHDVVGAVLDDARLGQPPCKLIGACFPEEGGPQTRHIGARRRPFLSGNGLKLIFNKVLNHFGV